MGYGQYMKSLLAPLRLYDLEQGAGAGELDALGQFLDGLFDKFVSIEKESVISTAEGEGLSAYESILPYAPVSGTTQERRKALCALLSIDGASFSRADIARTLAGCGVSAQAHETDSPEVVRITFPGKRGVPDGIEALKTRIESILPCHLDVVYDYSYPSWAEIQETFAAWSDIDGESWQELERIGEAA